MTKKDPAEIASFLAAVDPRLASLIGLVGPPPHQQRLRPAQRFDRLAVAILHQQLAGSAASAITQRVRNSLGGIISADSLSRTIVEDLRSAGCSEAKALALLDLAARASDGRLDLTGIARRTDDEVIAALSSVRGIGRWTAEMFLMGPLGRPDVWPTGDLGVRRGFGLIQGSAESPTPTELQSLADPHRPHRSSLAWYCWQAVDVARVNGGVLPR